MELPANLDLHRIIFVQVGLSTLASTSVSPSYNLPIHLYGLYNIENDIDNPNPVTAEGLRQYCILLVLTIVLDLFWMYNWSSSTSALPFIMILIGLIIKPISLLTCLNQFNRNGRGFTPFSSSFGISRQNAFHDSNNTTHSNPAGRNLRETPVRWAAPHSAQQFRRAENVPPPGPSPVSHQATAAHEFGLDGDADAQHLSDEEVLQAKKELDMRIAQKKQQIQQDRQLKQQHETLSSSQPFQTNSIAANSVDGSGYHTIE